MSEPVVYDYKGAAARMGEPVSADWLQKNKHRIPHCQFGDRVGFTEAQLFVIAELMTVTPGQTAQSVEQPTPLPTPAPQPLQNLRPRGARKKSA